MKLEFFEDALDGEPLILLYGGGRDEVGLLRKHVRALAERIGARLAIDELPFVQSIDGCRLCAISAKSNVGVVAITTPRSFEWTLDQESWLQTDELLEPFCARQRLRQLPEESAVAAFQFLNAARGPQIIYSTVRGW